MGQEIELPTGKLTIEGQDIEMRGMVDGQVIFTDHNGKKSVLLNFQSSGATDLSKAVYSDQQAMVDRPPTTKELLASIPSKNLVLFYNVTDRLNEKMELDNKQQLKKPNKLK